MSRHSSPVPSGDSRQTHAVTHGERASSPAVTPGDRPDLSTYLKRALQRLGLQLKDLEFYWGVDHSYVSRILSNKDALRDDRIAQLPRDLQIAMHEEWAKDLDVTTGRKADVGRALESLSRILIDGERLTNLPFRMARCEPEEER